MSVKSDRLVHVALALVVLLGVLRGGATSISKYISIHDVPPVGYAMWQSAVAMLLLLIVGYWQVGKFPNFSGNYTMLAICGLIGTAFPNVIFFFVVRHLPAGTMAVILTLVPLITYALVLMLRQEHADWIRIVGIVLGFLGAVLIAAPDLSNGLQVDLYSVLALLCPLGYALMGVYTAGQSGISIHPFYLAAGTHMFSVMFLFPAALLTDQFHPLWQTWEFTDMLIICHGILAAVAYSLFFIIVRLAGAVYYSFSHYIVAITGLGWGWFIFAERHSPWFWLAVVLILSGLAIVNQRQRVVAPV